MHGPTTKMQRSARMCAALLLMMVATVMLYVNRDHLWPRSPVIDPDLTASPAPARATMTATAAREKRPPIARAPRPAPAATPTAVLLDFTADGDSYHQNMAASRMSDLVRDALRQPSHVRWLEREQLRAAEAELRLSALMAADPSRGLRVGKWLKADLLVRGRFVEPGGPRQRLRIDVIDLGRADSIATRELPVPESLVVEESAIAARAPAVADAVVAALAEAQQVIQKRARARLIAPLFFRNLSPTDRLDHLESQVVEELAKAAEAVPQVHVLRFPDADPALREAELAVLGLTDSDPMVWQHVADLYVWGSYREVGDAARLQQLPFEQTEVELTVNVWSCAGEARTLTERSTVAGLPAARRRLAEQVARLAAEDPAQTVSLEARDTLIMLLLRRAWDAGAQGGWTPRSPAGLSPLQKQARAYALRMTDVACFLAPEDVHARVAQLQQRWCVPPPDGAARVGFVLGQVDAAERFIKLFGPVVKGRGGEPDDGASRLRLESLRTLLMLRGVDGGGSSSSSSSSSSSVRVGPPPGDWPDSALRPVREQALRGLARTSTEWFEVMAKGGQQQRWTMGRTAAAVIGQAVRCDADPLLRVAVVEAWWPVWREPRPEGPAYPPLSLDEEGLLQAYTAAGRLAEGEELQGEELLSSGPVASVAIRNGNGADAQGPAGSAANSAVAAILRRRAEGTLAAPAPARAADPSDSAGDLAVRDDAIPELRAPMRYLDLTRMKGSVVHTTDPRKLYRIDAMAYAGGRLWLGVRGSEPKLLYYEPPADRFTSLTDAQLGKHSAILDIQSLGQSLWVGLEQDGLWQLDPRSLQLIRYSGEQGLVSRQIRSIAGADDRVFAAGPSPKVSVLHAGSGHFSDWVPPAKRVQADGTLTDHRPGSFAPLRVCGQWLLHGDDALVHLQTGEVRVLEQVLLTGLGPPKRANAGERGGDKAPTQVPRSWRIDTVAAADPALWMAGTGALLRYQPGDGQLRHWPLPGDVPCLLAPDGDFVWVAYTQETDAVEAWFRTVPTPRSSLLLWHVPSQAWVGAVRVPGQITALCVAPTHVWVGLYNARQQLLEIDKLACYRRAAVSAVATTMSVPEHAAADGTALGELLAVAHGGDVVQVRHLLERGVSARAATEDGQTPLMAAAAAGRLEVVQLLLDRGADIVARRTEWPRVTAMHLAAASGGVEVAGLLLDRGSPVDDNVHGAGTALAMAVANRQWDVASLLLGRGADARLPVTGPPGYPSNPASPQHSILELAVAQTDRRIVRLLLDRGGKAALWRGGEARRLAAATGQQGIVEDLLAAGVDPAAADALCVAVQRRDTQMVRVMLGSLGGPGTVERVGPMPLILACDRGNLDIVRQLIAAGFDVNGSGDLDALRNGYRGGHGVVDTPLTAAAASGNGPLVRLLMEHGVDPRRQVSGMAQIDRALSGALRPRMPDMVALLVDLGANPNAQDAQGRTALAYALDGPVQSVLPELLMALGADPRLLPEAARAKLVARRRDGGGAAASPATSEAAERRPSPWLAGHLLAKAAEQGDAAQVRRLLSWQASPDARSADGWPALALAAYRGHVDVVQALLKARPQLDATGPAGWTALMQASVEGHASIVRLLVDGGVELQAQNSIGQTAHDLAVVRGRVEVAKVLADAGAVASDARRLLTAVQRGDTEAIGQVLDSGANVNAADEQGRTALFYAIDGRIGQRLWEHRSQPSLAVVQLLLERGADAGHADKQGKTPLLFLFEGSAMDADDRLRPDPLLVRLFLAHGGSQTIRGEQGRAVLAAARKIGDDSDRQAIIRMFKEAGAKE